jgi:hypothetical protein
MPGSSEAWRASIALIVSIARVALIALRTKETPPGERMGFLDAIRLARGVRACSTDSAAGATPADRLDGQQRDQREHDHCGLGNGDRLGEPDLLDLQATGTEDIASA